MFSWKRAHINMWLGHVKLNISESFVNFLKINFKFSSPQTFVQLWLFKLTRSKMMLYNCGWTTKTKKNSVISDLF